MHYELCIKKNLPHRLHGFWQDVSAEASCKQDRKYLLSTVLKFPSKVTKLTITLCSIYEILHVFGGNKKNAFYEQFNKCVCIFLFSFLLNTQCNST